MDQKKLGRIVLDIVFGLLLLYLFYIYILYRFKFDVYFDNDAVSMETTLGQSLNIIKSVLIGCVAQRCGHQVADLAQETFNFLVTALSIRFIPRGSQVPAEGTR